MKWVVITKQIYHTRTVPYIVASLTSAKSNLALWGRSVNWLPLHGSCPQWFAQWRIFCPNHFVSQQYLLLPFNLLPSVYCVICQINSWYCMSPADPPSSYIALRRKKWAVLLQALLSCYCPALGGWSFFYFFLLFVCLLAILFVSAVTVRTLSKCMTLLLTNVLLDK